MKAMKNRAVRQSGGTTEFVDGEIIHTMGNVGEGYGGTHDVQISTVPGGGFVGKEPKWSLAQRNLNPQKILDADGNPVLNSDGNFTYTFGDLAGTGDWSYERTHGNIIERPSGTGGATVKYGYAMPNPSVGYLGGLLHIAEGSNFQREYLTGLNAAIANKAANDAAQAAAAAAPVETPPEPTSGTVPYTGDLNLGGEPLLNPFGQWTEWRTDPDTGERYQVDVATPDWVMDEWEARKGVFPMNLPGAPDLGQFAFNADRNLQLRPEDAVAYWTNNFDQYGNFTGTLPEGIFDPDLYHGMMAAGLDGSQTSSWSPDVNSLIDTYRNSLGITVGDNPVVQGGAVVPSNGAAGVNNWNIIPETGYEPWRGIVKGENIGGGYNRNNNVGYNPSVATGDGMAFDWSTYNPDSPFQGSPVFGEYTPQQQYTSLQSTRMPEYYMPGYSSMAQRGYAPTFGSFLLGGYGQNQGGGLGQGTRFADWFTGGGREPSNITGGWNQALAFSNMMPGSDKWNQAQGVSPGMAYAMQDPDAVQAMALSRYYGGGVPQSSYASRAVASSLGDLYNRFTARGIQQGATGPSSYLGYLSNLDPTRWGAYA